MTTYLKIMFHLNLLVTLLCFVFGLVTHESGFFNWAILGGLSAWTCLALHEVQDG